LLTIDVFIQYSCNIVLFYHSLKTDSNKRKNCRHKHMFKTM